MRKKYFIIVVIFSVMLTIAGCSDKSNPVGPQDKRDYLLTANVADEYGNRLKDVRVHYIPILKDVPLSLGKTLPTTVIHFQIPETEVVSLDLLRFGTRDTIARIINNDTLNAGSYSTSFDATKLTNGVYLYILRSDKYLSEKKLLLLNFDNELQYKDPLTTTDSKGSFELPYKIFGIGEKFARAGEDTPDVFGYSEITDSMYIYLCKDGYRDYKEKIKIDTTRSELKTFRMEKE